MNDKNRVKDYGPLSHKHSLMLNCILDKIGLELRHVSSGMSTSLKFCWKDTHEEAYEKTVSFSYVDAWNTGTEKEALDMLLGDIIEFDRFASHLDDECLDQFEANVDSEVIESVKNPYLGCKTIEEACIVGDLLGEDKDE